MVKFCAFFLFFLLGLGSEESTLVTQINFTNIGMSGLAREEFGTYPELKTWALFQGMRLKKDSKLNQIHDGICRMISPKGLDFYLEVDKDRKKKVFLYLDLTTYESKPDSKYPVRRLSVFIRGKLQDTILFQPGQVAENPAVFVVEPGQFENGRINIQLIPDYTEGGKFWGIWDAFYTDTKVKP